ncbi:MAG: VWA domain-containing protein [Verrucomicrobiales bacterium]|nr:VWA domain-containing protein [Verrucomicrobiales bacterium]
MPQTLTEPSSSTPSPASAEMGLLAWLENTRIRLPLKGVEARFEVATDVAHVEIDQIFHQTASQPLDCTYVFPLPAEAAIHRCEIHINDRVIQARIEELQAARTLFQDAKSAGHRAALVESLRPNLFTLNLANVQPQDLIVVRLAYVQTLERIGEERRLRIPSCPGVRYIPGVPLLRPNLDRGVENDTSQVPDASRISPPRISALHPDAAYLSVSGVLRIPSSELSAVTISSHPMRHSGGAESVQFQLAAESAIPDQDFLLGWTVNPLREMTPRAWGSRRGDQRYLLVELRAPSEIKAVKRQPLDVYFLLDRSGSMSGGKWVKACEAFFQLLGQLDPADRIHVTVFSSGSQPLELKPLFPGEFLRRWSPQRLVDLGTDGGTELLPALHSVCQCLKERGEEAKPILILLTDGQVGNEAEIAAALRGYPRLVLHTLGIDVCVNDALLGSIARQHRGQCVLIRPDEDLKALLGGLGRLVTTPVVTDLQIPPVWESADGPLPDLYAGQTATALLRGPLDGHLEIRGRSPQGSPVPIPLAIQSSDSPLVPLLWARRRLADLADRIRLPECIAVAKEFNLLCQGTAFVAWDEQEKTVVASETLWQPSLEPVASLFQHATGILGTRFGGMGLCDSEPEDLGLHAYRLGSAYVARGAAENPGDVRPPRISWENHPILQEPGGSELRSFLDRWLADKSDLARNYTEGRLVQWLEEITALQLPTPGKAFSEFVRRVREFLAQGDPLRGTFERLCRKMGW